MAVCALTPISSELPELDGKSGFSFWEALLMTVLYIGYIIVMSQNDKVVAMIGAPPPGFEEQAEPEPEPEPDPETASNPLAAAKQKAVALKTSMRSAASRDSKNSGSGDDLARSLSADGGHESGKAVDSRRFESEDGQKEREEGEGGVFSLLCKPFSLLFSVTIPPCDEEEWEVGQPGGAKYCVCVSLCLSVSVSVSVCLSSSLSPPAPPSG